MEKSQSLRTSQKGRGKPKKKGSSKTDKPWGTQKIKQNNKGACFRKGFEMGRGDHSV